MPANAQFVITDRKPRAKEDEYDFCALNKNFKMQLSCKVKNTIQAFTKLWKVTK